MSLLSLLYGEKSYIDIVKSFIEKIFKSEAKKYHCKPHELKIVINREIDGTMSIMSWSDTQKKPVRIIPDKEVQEILMK